MKVCPFCNSQYSDDVKFCQQCGHELSSVNPDTSSAQNSYETSTQNNYNANQQNNSYNTNQQNSYNANQQYDYNTNPQYNMNNNYNEPTASLGSIQLNTTKLTVWSIVNLICCCMPLGIASLIFSLTAKNKPTPEEQNKALKTALTLCLIGTIGGVIVEFLYVLLMFFLGSSGYGYMM